MSDTHNLKKARFILIHGFSLWLTCFKVQTEEQKDMIEEKEFNSRRLERREDVRGNYALLGYAPGEPPLSLDKAQPPKCVFRYWAHHCMNSLISTLLAWPNNLSNSWTFEGDKPKQNILTNFKSHIIVQTMLCFIFCYHSLKFSLLLFILTCQLITW